MLFLMPYPVPFIYQTWNLTSYVFNSFTSIEKLTLLNLRKIIGPCCRSTEISTQSYDIFNCVNTLIVYGPHFMVKIYWTASQNIILYKLFCDRVVINWVFHRDWKIKASCMHHQRDDWKVWVNIAVHKNCSALRIITSGLHQSYVTCC